MRLSCTGHRGVLLLHRTRFSPDSSKHEKMVYYHSRVVHFRASEAFFDVHVMATVLSTSEFGSQSLLARGESNSL